MLRRPSVLLPLVLTLTIGAAAPALAGTEDDEAIAENTVLTQGDVAELGLGEEPPSDLELPSGTACKKVRPVVKTAAKQAQAATRFAAQASLLEDRVFVYKSAKAAKAPLAAYASRQGARCVESELDVTLQAILKDGTEYTFDELSPASVDLGDDSAVFQAEVDLSDGEGKTGKAYAEFGLIRVGRGVAVMRILSLGVPFDGSQDLATILTDRLTESLDG